LELHFSPGDSVVQGQVLAAGRVKLGDHLFVDKVRYNFTRPKRGDIIVFSTDKIVYPRIRPNSFYIKRLAALPGERVAIDPPYLVINGKRITEPYPFRRLLDERDKGYIGYTMAHRQGNDPVYLKDPQVPQTLGPDEFLPLGDNTAYSLDGRYFGPVNKESLVGPAMLVYWPFTRRIGRAR
jgi:signal peptidase I